MVLSSDQSKKLFKNENSMHKFLMLNVEDVHEGMSKIKYSIEVLNIINVIQDANSLYKASGSDIRISTNIYYEIMKSIFNEITLTDSQLVEYLETARKLVDFWRLISRYKDIETALPFEIDFMLFGLSFDEQEELDRESSNDAYNGYADIFYRIGCESVEAKVLVKRAKKLMESYKQKTILKSA